MYLARMSNLPAIVAKQLYGKERLEDVPVAEVERMVQRYPYFIPARLLEHQIALLTDADAAFLKSQALVLFYPDPLSLQFNLHQLAAGSTEPALDFEQPADEKTTDHFSAEAITSTPEPIVEVANDGQLHLAPNDEFVAVTEDTVTPVENVAVIAQTEPANLSPLLVDAMPAVTAKEAVEEVAFEPFHTVDYFASQGIKIKADENPTDRLGKQLKSFTQWLRTMKPLTVTEETPGAENASHRTVSHLATESLLKADVVTEAMAEVWARQGNVEKATETFTKLGLLYPSKSAYFATKIENLKLR